MQEPSLLIDDRFYQDPNKILNYKIIEEVFEKYPDLEKELNSVIKSELIDKNKLIYLTFFEEQIPQKSLTKVRKAVINLRKSINKKIAIEDDKLTILNMRIYLKELFEAYELI